MSDLKKAMPNVEGSGGGCFRAGTMVSTPNGSVAIETLKDGDPIYAFDEKGNVRPAVVRELHVHEKDKILRVEFWGGELYITGNHWVLNQYNAFVEMQSLSVEDTLVDLRGHLRPIKSVSEFEEGAVYNLTVEPYHTFIADGIRVHNGGGGKSAGGAVNTRSPKESPNTLRSVATARVLDLLCEGPIRGLVNGAQSIFFDDTPLENSDGSLNFQGVTWDTRLGYTDQDPMPGFDDVETEHSVETEITRQAGPLVRQINDTDIDAARIRLRFPNLSYQDSKTGDLKPNSVELKLEVKPSDGDYRAINFVYEEDDRTGQTTTGNSCVGFKAIVQKTILVRLNEVAETTLELRYRLGSGAWTSLGAKTISKIIKNVANKSQPDGYIDGQPAYYYTFTATYSIDGLGANNYEIDLVQGDEISSFTAYTQSNLTIKGKNTSPTEKSYRFSLPGTGPWTIRLSRVTADSDQVNNQNTTYWAAYTEIIEEKFIYPDTAYIGMAVNSALFGNQIPKRAYEVYGREVAVPKNYDPDTRTYTGIWDGTFKSSWTDNPAWCFMDMVVNDRFGLGHVVSVDDIDSAKLYEIAQYCDELVPNGFGGTEPRFTLNCCINTRTEAYQLLNTMVSVFRGMIYWASGSVSFGQDAPRDIEVLVGRANVIDGHFTYQTSSGRAQHNSILVTWNDPNDFSRTNIEVVEDNRDISARGLRQTDVYAFGCNSRGQASRFGKWMLYTAQNELETVTYRASLDHLNVVPGMIAGIVDPQESGADFAGRTLGIDGLTITLDREVTFDADESYELWIVDEDGAIQSRDIVSHAGQTTNTFSVASIFDLNDGDFSGADFAAEDFAEIQNSGKMWAIVSTTVEPRPFRITSIVEVEGNIFEVTGVEYNPSKHDFVDRDFVLEPVNYSTLSVGDIATPTDLDIQESLFKSNNQVRTRATLSWTGGQDSRVFMYKVAWRTSDGGILQEKYTGDESIELLDLEPETYDFYVYAIAAAGQSAALKAEDHEILGKTAPPGDVSGLTAIRKVNGVVLSWSAVTDLDLVGYEIRQGTEWADATYVADIVGTSIFVSIDDAEETTFLIRAKDELDILSDNVASVVSSVIEPDTPPVFTATAQADYVLFRWDRVSGINNIYEVRRGQSWGLAEKIGESSGDEMLILDPQRDDAVYWIKAKSTAGLYSTDARAASAQRALIPDRNVILEYDNANDGGAGLYPGYTFNMELGPDSTLVLEELSTGVYAQRGEHYFEVDLGQEYRARNWLETTLINLANNGGPTWAEWTYAWNATESQVAWLPLLDLYGAAIEKVIAWKRSPLAEELYAWSFQDTLDDFRGETPAESQNTSYSTAKFGNGVMISDITKIEYDVTLDFTFTLSFKLRVEEPLTDKRIFAVLKDAQDFSSDFSAADFASGGDTLTIGFDHALEGGSIFVLDSDGNLLYLPIDQTITGLNFLTIGITQDSDSRALYYKSEREYFSGIEEAALAPLANTFTKLYLYNVP